MIVSDSTIRSTLITFILFTFLTIISTASYAQITVTNLNNDGPGSLRDAIEFANSNPGQDEIVFRE